MSSGPELLAVTNQLARDLLAQPDNGIGLGAYRNWQTMISQAAETWRTADPAAPASDPFAAIQAMIDSSERPDFPFAVATDQRVTAMIVQLIQLAAADRSQQAHHQTALAPTSAQLQGSVLHNAYLITHAAGLALRRETAGADSPDLLAQLNRARETVGVAEQMLEIHLHQQPDRPAAGLRLNSALTRWTAATHQVLSGPPEPKNNYIISDVHHGLIAYTVATLASAGPAQLQSIGVDVRDRLLPALQHSAGTWQDVRHTWAGLAAPTTGISRPLADAARQLQRALRDPNLDRTGHTGHLLAGALAAAVLTARGLADQFQSDQLQAPADTVVALTRSILDRTPERDPYPIWAGMTRHEGRAPVNLPDVLRGDFTRTAHRNLDAARVVSSAAHSLLTTSTDTFATTQRIRTPGIDHAERASAHRSRDPVALGR